MAPARSTGARLMAVGWAPTRTGASSAPRPNPNPSTPAAWPATRYLRMESHELLRAAPVSRNPGSFMGAALVRVGSPMSVECETCDGTGLVYRDNPEHLGYLLAEDCAACLGLGERPKDAP